MQDYTLDQIQDIVTEARQAAKNASQTFVDDWKAKTGGNEYGEPMYCGFASTKIYGVKASTKLGKAFKAAGITRITAEHFRSGTQVNGVARAWTLRRQVPRHVLTCLESTASRPTWIQGQTNLGVDTPARGCYTVSIIRQQKEGKMTKFAIHTQTLENYGAHSEDGKFSSGNH